MTIEIEHCPSDLQFAGAISKAALMNAELVEHAEQKVRHRRMNRSDNVPISLKLS